MQCAYFVTAVAFTSRYTSSSNYISFITSCLYTYTRRIYQRMKLSERHISFPFRSFLRFVICESKNVEFTRYNFFFYFVRLNTTRIPYLRMYNSHCYFYYYYYYYRLSITFQVSRSMTVEKVILQIIFNTQRLPLCK